LPRGTSLNLPTAGSGDGLGATLAATVTDSLAETMAAPPTLRPPPAREKRVLPPTEEMRLPRSEAAPVRLAAVPITPPVAVVVPALAGSKTGRNVTIAVLAAAAVGLAIFFLWPKPQPAPAPIVSETVVTPVPSVVSNPEPTPPPAAAAAPEVVPKPLPPPKAPPGPTEASFELTTTPAGAEAVFDGNPDLRCTTPCALNLAMGRHTLALKSPGYREAQRVFSLPSEPGLIVNLEAAAGTLSLVTNPPGLTVVIDGQEQARKTPANFTLPVGDHRVQVLRGTEKQEFTAQIRDNVVSQKNIDWGQ